MTGGQQMEFSLCILIFLSTNLLCLLGTTDKYFEACCILIFLFTNLLRLLGTPDEYFEAYCILNFYCYTFFPTIPMLVDSPLAKIIFP